MKNYHSIFYNLVFLNLLNLIYPDLEIKTIEFEIAKNNYKYVKIIAKKLGKVPEWHKGYPYDGRGWVFVDEISIK